MDHKKIIKALKRLGYEVSYFMTAEEATAYLIESVRGQTVGFGDSATLAAMKLAERLSENNEVVDPSDCTNANFIPVAKQTLLTDVFFTSVNGVSETGELVNIDGTGNRVAGSLFGHKKVYFVFGINKIEPTLEKAIWRARNIAAPKNAQRLGLKTPCAIKGDKCYDCLSPDRICNGMAVYLHKMHDMEVEVVIINEELGL